LEALVHAAIDYGKCESWFSFHWDQILHVLAKVVWAALFVYYLR
jgi:hypothetical protein